MEQILAHRPWLNDRVQCRLQQLSDQLGSLDVDNTQSLLDRLVLGNQMIHEQEAVNLNPATNVMNPKAENMLSANLGSRPSLGYPGDKYEMGLEAIEGIEYVANQLVANVFDARYVETRVASGAMANLYSYMATCNPGDTIIIPPLSIGGHATHQIGGAAGLYGLNIVTAPVNALDYTIDTDGLRRLTREVRPKVITVGSSLNLWHHPVEKVREIADEVGAYVLFDAAHLCGVIAGGVWPNPLKRGAHLMGFSTYKSLGGPPNGILLTDTPNLAESIEEIAYPGLTANFDVAKSAALAVTMLDWLSFGSEYAQAMVQVSTRLAQELATRGLPVFGAEHNYTQSHQFALKAEQYGGGQNAARRLRDSNILTCGIGLPIEPVTGDVNGLRLGTPEMVRRGMTADDASDLADLLDQALTDHADRSALAKRVAEWRAQFSSLHFIRS